MSTPLGEVAFVVGEAMIEDGDPVGGGARGAGEETTRGRLLVATPDLLDENFARTVVLVLDHDSDGAVGVVLNRPSDTDIATLFPDWSTVLAAPQVAFVGGPVSQDSVIALARGRGDESPGWVPVVGGLATVDLAMEPDELEAQVDQVRVFAGYSGWAAGQLDAELAAGGWFVFDAHVDDAFDSVPEDLWASVLRRQGGTTAWFATCPPDPSVN